MKIKEFFRSKAWKKWDKSQWTIIVLTGVLLMILAIPTEQKDQETMASKKNETETVMENGTAQTDYVREMENRLKETLSAIEGAGRVEVMITLEDMGESVVEKDTVKESSDLQETDQEGGIRKDRKVQVSGETVYKEGGSEKTPFIGKEITPKIAGVLVVAQGGENTVVKQNISEAVMALFQIDVNRIKVVKMNIQEER